MCTSMYIVYKYFSLQVFLCKILLQKIVNDEECTLRLVLFNLAKNDSNKGHQLWKNYGLTKFSNPAYVTVMLFMVYDNGKFDMVSLRCNVTHEFMSATASIK